MHGGTAVLCCGWAVFIGKYEREREGGERWSSGAGAKRAVFIAKQLYLEGHKKQFVWQSSSFAYCLEAKCSYRTYREGEEKGNRAGPICIGTSGLVSGKCHWPSKWIGGRVSKTTARFMWVAPL